MKFCVFLFLFSLSSFSSIYRIIDDPVEAISIRYSLLKSAKKKIYSSKYIFHHDFAAYTSLVLFREKAEEIRENGETPDIRILIDRFGKFFKSTPAEVVYYLMSEYGIQFKYYNDVLNKKFMFRKVVELDPIKTLEHRLHDKLFIVDGEYMVTGGRNIQDAYYSIDKKNYVDRDVFTNGQAAKASEEHFLKFWNNPASTIPNIRTGLGTMSQCVLKYKTTSLKKCLLMMKMVGKKILDKHQKKISPMVQKLNIDEKFYQRVIEQEEDDPTVEFIGDHLDEGGNYHSRMSRRLVEIAQKATKEIVIENAYFVPTKALLEILNNKLYEGVKVIIHTNSLSSTDNNEAYAGYFKYRKTLMELGPISNKIKLYEFQGKYCGSDFGDAIHAKSASIDGIYSIIGSYNLDKLSEYYNTEVALISKNPVKSNQLTNSINSHIKLAYQVGLDGVPCHPDKDECIEDKYGNVFGGQELHPNAEEKNIKRVNLYMRFLNMNNSFSRYIEKHL